MKTLFLASAIMLSSTSARSADFKLEDIKQIVCDSTVRYEKDSPNDKTTVRGIKIFTPGSRNDVGPRPGAFLLAEYQLRDDAMTVFDNQQFYFKPINDGKLSFEFIASWKSEGVLQLGQNNTASGFINSKDHITELSCALVLK